MRRFRSGRSTEAWNVLAAWFDPTAVSFRFALEFFVSWDNLYQFVPTNLALPFQAPERFFCSFCRKPTLPAFHGQTDHQGDDGPALAGRFICTSPEREEDWWGPSYSAKSRIKYPGFCVISRPSTSDSWLYLTCIFFISVFWFCSVMYVVSRHRPNLCDASVRLRLWFGFHQGRSIVGDEGRLAESFCGGSDFVLQHSTLQATCGSNLKCRRVIWATQGPRKFRCKFNLWFTWNYTESQRDVSENCGTCWRWFGVHADAHHTSEDCRACWRWSGINADSHYASEDCRACWRWSGVHADAHHTQWRLPGMLAMVWLPCGLTLRQWRLPGMLAMVWHQCGLTLRQWRLPGMLAMVWHQCGLTLRQWRLPGMLAMVWHQCGLTLRQWRLPGMLAMVWHQCGRIRRQWRLPGMLAMVWRPCGRIRRQWRLPGMLVMVWHQCGRIRRQWRLPGMRVMVWHQCGLTLHQWRLPGMLAMAWLPCRRPMPLSRLLLLRFLFSCLAVWRVARPAYVRTVICKHLWSWLLVVHLSHSFEICQSAFSCIYEKSVDKWRAAFE